MTQCPDCDTGNQKAPSNGCFHPFKGAYARFHLVFLLKSSLNAGYGSASPGSPGFLLQLRTGLPNGLTRDDFQLLSSLSVCICRCYSFLHSFSHVRSHSCVKNHTFLQSDSYLSYACRTVLSRVFLLKYHNGLEQIAVNFNIQCTALQLHKAGSDSQPQPAALSVPGQIAADKPLGDLSGIEI